MTTLLLSLGVLSVCLTADILCHLIAGGIKTMPEQDLPMKNQANDNQASRTVHE